MVIKMKLGRFLVGEFDKKKNNFWDTLYLVSIADSKSRKSNAKSDFKVNGWSEHRVHVVIFAIN